ncbi:carboxypeptidase-like regulatory domain-containing protein [Bizionia argentinensis JUB59]|uniref:Carboxypeptidase-like regulatory domain-containing protein n=1 Tax=Bizionia argentinensis JUB59 TaxID=1046627 RepID=G2ECY8_9FLAO|nr:carboxypeptidase-like regulatory domain-containing protein [Bizionia argentinensis]EGV43786.1 carboxypeptidase-like regulatory domain-containing protein [Bizionia argentinensis JUB59]
MKVKYLFFIVLFCVLKTYSQTVSGVVIDSNTNQPIEGASVYFDNTTVGTISNEQGLFNIQKPTAVTSPLVISFLGYKKQVISGYSPDEKLSVLLVEDISALNEVFLVSKDSWSRERKMKEFKTSFFGISKNALSCEILNEDDIRLQFLEDQNKLVASATVPLIIMNKKLKYQIQYDLQDFEIDYNYQVELDSYFASSVYYAGTMFYTSESNSRNIVRRRIKAYKGSVLHFMRSLLEEKLKENKFILLFNGREVLAENFISVSNTDNPSIFQVELHQPLTVVSENDIEKNSVITSSETYFYLDRNGNHMPADALIFKGYFGNNRVGDTLPLDYQQDEK